MHRNCERAGDRTLRLVNLVGHAAGGEAGLASAFRGVNQGLEQGLCWGHAMSTCIYTLTLASGICGGNLGILPTPSTFEILKGSKKRLAENLEIVKFC